MRKLAFLLALLLTLLSACAASAEGILPVLQTPPPEISETVSYHRVMNFSSTPSASSASDGSFYYEYSSVTYKNYLAFGRALAQEGFTLKEGVFTENGLPQLTVEKDGTALTVDYNPFYREMTVRYPPRVLAWEVDEDRPYVIDDASPSVLPDLPQVVSYHRVMNYGSPSSGESYGEGRWCYDYSVDYDHYLKFGRALAQEGFALTSSETTEDAATRAVVSNGTVELTLIYNPFTHGLRVVYPRGALAEEADRENRYEVDPAQAAILPELKQTISLHAVTGKVFPNPDRVEDRYRYMYYDVPYPAYAQFSIKLAEEGFTLVSSEKTEEGYDRAVVSDGDVTLTLDYDQEGQRATVYYPLDVSPRDAAKFDDYTLVGTGDTILLNEDLTATVIGWEKVDKYVTYYYDNNWIPFAKYFDNEYTSGNGIQRILVTFEIENNRPESLTARYLLNELKVYCDGDSVSCDYGDLTSEAKFSTDSDDYLSPKDKLTFAVGFALRDEQAAHPQNVAVTFTDKNNAIQYAYLLEP